MEILLRAIDRHDYACALMQINRLVRSSNESPFLFHIIFMEPFIKYYASMPEALSTLDDAIMGITPDILQQNIGSLLHMCMGSGLNEYLATRLPKDPILTIDSFPHLCRYKLSCRDYEAIDKFLVGIDKQSDRYLSKDQALRHLRWKEALALMVARSQVSLLTESTSAQTIITKSARTLFKLALFGYVKNFLPNLSLFNKTISQDNTLFLKALHRQSPISILANLIEYDVFIVMASGINDQGMLQNFLLDLDKLKDISCEPQMDPTRHALVAETPSQGTNNQDDLSMEEEKDLRIYGACDSNSLLLKLHAIHPRIMVVRSLLSKLHNMGSDTPPESLWDLVYKDMWNLFLSYDVVDALDVCSVMNLNYRLQMDIIFFLRDGKDEAKTRINIPLSEIAEFNSYKSVFTGKDAYISVSSISAEILLKVLLILSKTVYDNFDIVPFGTKESAAEGPLLFIQRDVNAALKHIIRTVFDAVLEGKKPPSVLIEVVKIVQDLRRTAYGFELKNLTEIIKYVWNKEAQYKENHVLTVFVMYVDTLCRYTQFKWYVRRNGSIVLPSDSNIQMKDISYQNKEHDAPKYSPLGSAENIQRAKDGYMEPFTLKSLQMHMDTVATVVADLLYRGKDFNSSTDDTIILLTVPMLISLLNLFQNPYFHEYALRSLDRCKTPRDKSGRSTGNKDLVDKRGRSNESERSGSPFSALIFKRHIGSEEESAAIVGAPVRQVFLSSDCVKSIDRAFSALIDIANDLYGHLNEIFSQKGLADAYPSIVANLLLLKQRMRTLNVEIWKSSLEEEVLYNFFDIANQQYQVFGSLFWRWFIERGIITQKPAHTIVSGIGNLSHEDACLILDESTASDKTTKSSKTKRKPSRPPGDTPLGTCKNPLCFPGQFLNARKSARFPTVPFSFAPLIQGSAQYGREFITATYQSIGSSMLELINPCYMFDMLAMCARMQVSSAYILSDSLELLYKWMNACLGYKTIKKKNLIGLLLGLTGLLSGPGESYLSYTKHKNHLIDAFDINSFSICWHLFDDGGFSRDESIGSLCSWTNSIPDTGLLTPSTSELTAHGLTSNAKFLRVETTLPLSPDLLYSNLWSYHLSNMPRLYAKSLALNPGILASKLYAPLSRHESFSNLLNYSLRMFLHGRSAVFTRRLSRSDALATFLIYHICSYIYLLMSGASKNVIKTSRNELATIFCDIEFLLQAKVSSDHDLANKAHAEFFDYHGFTQRLPPLDLLFNIPLLKYWLERLGALTVSLPIASEVSIRSCDLSVTIPLVIIIASATIFKENGLMDDVQTNIDAAIECISRKTVDQSVEPTRQLCLACLHNILRFNV